MSWQDRHLSDISDIYRTYNGHNWAIIWQLLGDFGDNLKINEKRNIKEINGNEGALKERTAQTTHKGPKKGSEEE